MGDQIGFSSLTFALPALKRSTYSYTFRRFMARAPYCDRSPQVRLHLPTKKPLLFLNSAIAEWNVHTSALVAPCDSKDLIAPCHSSKRQAIRYTIRTRSLRHPVVSTV